MKWVLNEVHEVWLALLLHVRWTWAHGARGELTGNAALSLRQMERGRTVRMRFMVIRATARPMSPLTSGLS